MTNKVIIILGPTAVGKSDVAIDLAKKINGEVISADSSQVYKGFDIGSGKVTAQEMQNIPHYLIDILDYDQEFNVALFKQLAEKATEEIYAKGKQPIICGGTGLYVKALTEGYNFFNVQKDDALRERYEKLAQEQGLSALFERLQTLFPERAETIDKNNKVRLIRALEIAENKGELIKIEPKYEYQIFVLNMDREVLYSRINQRVDKMVQQGLFDEVQALIDKGANLSHSSMKSIGYKEVYEYLVDKTITKEQAIENIKQTSRKYAKRQLTWLRSIPDAIWLDNTDKQKTVETIYDFIKKR